MYISRPSFRLLAGSTLLRNFVTLVPGSSPAPPLQRLDEKILLNHEWAHPPFGHPAPSLLLPVYRLQNGTFSGQNAVLDPSIFNVPIRRDIINNVFKYERHGKYKKTHRTKTVGDVAGSGRKPHPQKHTGRARQGYIRASINYHGGKIFGAMPKDYKFPINKKVRLLAMKSLLSARLAENKILLFEDAKAETRRTASLAEQFYPLKDANVLFLTERPADRYFMSASQNLPRLTVLPAIEAGVKPILKNEFLAFSLDGLRQLEATLLSREENYFRNRKVERKALPYDSLLPPNKQSIMELVKEHVDKKPQENLAIFSYSLREYLKDLQQYQKDKAAPPLVAAEDGEEDEEGESEEEEENGEEGKEKTEETASAHNAKQGNY